MRHRVKTASKQKRARATFEGPYEPLEDVSDFEQMRDDWDGRTKRRRNPAKRKKRGSSSKKGPGRPAKPADVVDAMRRMINRVMWRQYYDGLQRKRKLPSERRIKKMISYARWLKTQSRSVVEREYRKMLWGSKR